LTFNHEAVAYWISPKGKILSLSTGETHISKVIENPEAFGYTKDIIQDTYDSYKETLGSENQAREEIIKNLLNEGWIRIRNNDSYYTIQINKLSKNSKYYIFDWATNLIPWVGPFTGILVSTKLKIMYTTITVILQEKMIESVRARKKLIPVESVFEL
jgi:hypothetical protein